jgi:hypothetical protein
MKLFSKRLTAREFFSNRADSRGHTTGPNLAVRTRSGPRCTDQAAFSAFWSGNTTILQTASRSPRHPFRIGNIIARPPRAGDPLAGRSVAAPPGRATEIFSPTPPRGVGLQSNNVAPETCGRSKHWKRGACRTQTGQGRSAGVGHLRPHHRRGRQRRRGSGIRRRCRNHFPESRVLRPRDAPFPVGTPMRFQSSYRVKPLNRQPPQ